MIEAYLEELGLLNASFMSFLWWRQWAMYVAALAVMFSPKMLPRGISATKTPQHQSSKTLVNPPSFLDCPIFDLMEVKAK